MPKKRVFSKDDYFKMLDKMLTLPAMPQPDLLIKIKDSIRKRSGRQTL